MATIDFLDLVCNRYDFFDDRQKKLANIVEENFDLKVRNETLGEQLGNVAVTMVQMVLLEQFYIDYQWPSASMPDVDESFEAELDAIKLFIER
jgi:regulator of replication initiation timing